AHRSCSGHRRRPLAARALRRSRARGRRPPSFLRRADCARIRLELHVHRRDELARDRASPGGASESAGAQRLSRLRARRRRVFRVRRAARALRLACRAARDDPGARGFGGGARLARTRESAREGDNPGCSTIIGRTRTKGRQPVRRSTFSLIALATALLAPAAGLAQGQGQGEVSCTRGGLRRAVDLYLEAQTSGDISKLPLAAGVAYIENMKLADIRQGML